MMARNRRALVQHAVLLFVVNYMIGMFTRNYDYGIEAE